MIRTCSRMAVLRDGCKVNELHEEQLDQDSIMKAIAGGAEMNKAKHFINKITGYRLFLPLLCLAIVLLINVIKTPSF